MSTIQNHGPLSVVIITFNEEKNILRCLESVKTIADEILVLDSFSSDQTISICLQNKIRVIQHPWLGYSLSKNYANSLAKYDWILSLDADECLSPELIQSILALKAKGKITLGKISRLTNYCGKWIRHSGWYPDYKIRLFNRLSCHWEGDLHEKIVYPNSESCQLLKGDCWHYSFPDVKTHYQKIELYSSLAAHELFSKMKKYGLGMKYASAIFKFINTFIFKLGFLDGKAGYYIAKLSAISNFKKYDLLERLHKSQTK